MSIEKVTTEADAAMAEAAVSETAVEEAVAEETKVKKELNRFSGILVHPTSFPSRYGIGDMGPGAYEFVDFLEESGQHLWQVLPLGPTGFGDSPYQGFSAFA